MRWRGCSPTTARRCVQLSLERSDRGIDRGERALGVIDGALRGRDLGIEEVILRDVGLGVVDRLPPLKRWLMTAAAGPAGRAPKLTLGTRL